MKTKTLVLGAAFAVAACNGDRDKIIADVCAPLSSGTNADVEQRGTQKGYDLDRVRAVCHQYALDQAAEAGKILRELQVGSHR